MGLLQRLTVGLRGMRDARDFRDFEADPENQRRPAYARPPQLPVMPQWLDPRSAGDVQDPNSVSAHLRGSPSTQGSAQGYLAGGGGPSRLPDALVNDSEPWRQAAPEHIGERVTPLEVGGAAYDGGLEPEGAPGGMPGVDLTQAWRQAYQRAAQPVAPMVGDFAPVQRDLQRQGGLLSRLRGDPAAEMRRRWQ